VLKRYLLTPGPTPVPDEVLLAGARGIVHHRSPEYSKLFLRVLEGLKYVFQTENDILVFSASGTGAMESAVTNLISPGDRVVVACNGNFGERWHKLNSAFGARVTLLDYDWGRRVDPGDIERELAADDDYVAVFCTQSETSTGVTNDIRAVAEAVRPHRAVLVVDAVSGLGATDLRTDEWGVDVVVSGSQKALMTPPGLAFASVGPAAWELARRCENPSFYLSWWEGKSALEDPSPQMPWTPPVGVMLSLEKALELIREEGLERVFHRHRVLALAAREAVKALGLELFGQEDPEATSVTAVKVPEGIDGSELTRILRLTYGVTIAGGQGQITGKIFRLGHCGYFGPFDIITAVAALEMALRDMGYESELGAGVAAAQRVFLEDKGW
jgi:aspartate aminotransferase-like enzyme